MLRYSVKLSGEMADFGELEWSEGVVSPDLSFVTGIVPTKYNVGKSAKLNATNTVTNTTAQLYVESARTIRNGYVIVHAKRYNVYSGVNIDYGSLMDMEMDGVHSYWYVIDNGRYVYLQVSDEDGSYVDPNGDRNGWLIAGSDGKLQMCSVPAMYSNYPFQYYENDTESGNPYVEIDMAYWVENGSVTIDGVDYEVDFEAAVGNGTRGMLLRTSNGNAVNPNTDIGCSGYSIVRLDDPYEVDRITLRKMEEDVYKIDDIQPFGYHMFVCVDGTYADVYEYLDDEENVSMRCDVPTNLVSVEAAANAVGDVLPCTVMMESAGLEFPFYADGYEVGDRVDELKPYITVDGQKVYVQYDLSRKVGGNMVMFTLANEIYNVNRGDTVVVREKSGGNIRLQVHNMSDYGGVKIDDYEERFVIFRGRKYCVVDHLFDKVVIGEDEYHIAGRYDDKAVVMINGERVLMKLVTVGDALKAERYGNAVIGSNEEPIVEQYEIIGADGIIVNGVGYEVFSSSSEYSYVVLDMEDEFHFKVMEKIGSSVIICRAGFADGDFTDEFTTSYVSEVIFGMNNSSYGYSLVIPNYIFGYYPIDASTVFKYTDNPFTSESNGVIAGLFLFEDRSYITLTLPLSTTVATNVNKDDLIENGLFDEENYINGIVDMEKDVYTPKYMVDNKYVGSTSTFNPIYGIQFNLHFRTRDLSNWKVVDGYNDFEVSGKTDNWFVTDYCPYKNDLATNDLMSLSDLLGFVGFTNNDIFMQKDKVSKSFLRLLFYDSPNENTQSLMCMSTMYLDARKLNKIYIDYKKRPDNVFVTAGVELGKATNRLTVFTEKLEGRSNVDYGFNDRLCASFKAVSKYESAVSSEGFYLYVFKEYSENLYPKPLYMKVEFNHAGIGKTVPMIVPMHWSDNENDNTKKPDHRLMLNDESDLAELKRGVPMAIARSQLYIPVYCVYDYKNKEFCYCFDSRYIGGVDSDGNVSVDLFEMKVMDESTSSFNMGGRSARINIEDKFSL